jgi:hypothetical protein
MGESVPLVLTDVYSVLLGGIVPLNLRLKTHIVVDCIHNSNQVAKGRTFSLKAHGRLDRTMHHILFVKDSRSFFIVAPDWKRL